MIPLRTDYGSEFGTATTETATARPHLVLHDTTQDAPTAQPARRKSRRGVERALLAVTIACTLLFLACTAVGSVWNQAVAAYAASHAQVQPVITIHVGQGDTLWRYAARYGDPNSYILDRVQAIAAQNKLASDANLTPGQTLRIAVQNPIELAKLNKAAHSRLASRLVH